MNRRLLLILVSAFVIAAACSYLVYRVVGTRLAVGQQKATRVIVAVNDVKLGSVLKDADLSTTDISGPLPKGAILKRQDAVGRGVISDLYQGEPILESRLAAVGSGGGLAATIRQGMRACAVKVDEVVGVAGFVTPGMRVDVLISGNPPGPANIAEGTEGEDAAAEHRSSLRRHGYSERRRRQTSASPGGQPIGYPGPGGAPEPGQQPDPYPACFAQSVGYANDQSARDCHGQSLCGWNGKAQTAS